MNINKLADLLDECIEDGSTDLVCVEQAATMLRQQQAEIEALKKDNKELHAIAQRMAMAESDARKSLQWFKDAKERQSEPVAWMDEINTFVLDKDYKQFPKNLQNGMIPLYTHPAKTLDRELLDKTIIDQQNEIKELRKNLDVALMIVNEPANTLTDEEILNVAFCSEVNTVAIENDWEGTVIDFARAILKKASEK